MTNKNEIYKCEICGNIVEVLQEGQGELVCCGQPMKLQEEKTQDPEKGEKHLPVIEKNPDNFLVKVGSVEHPMTKDHYIEWIELTCGCGTIKKFLKPGEKPEANFPLCDCEKPTAREYCNLHGLWRTDK